MRTLGFGQLLRADRQVLAIDEQHPAHHTCLIRDALARASSATPVCSVDLRH